MVDPVHFTNFNHTLVELEEKVLFSILVAGKTALTTAKCLEKFLASLHWKLGIYNQFRPFHCVRQFEVAELAEQLHASGIGCQNSKGKSIHQLAHSGLDLRTCTVEQLEKIHGIGPKTARMFVMHTRPNQQYAALDTHILKYLRDCGYDVPSLTPRGKRYRELEIIFLELARRAGKTAADFDLELWNMYRQKRRKAG